jgi:hypothetical protein
MYEMYADLHHRTPAGLKNSSPPSLFCAGDPLWCMATYISYIWGVEGRVMFTDQQVTITVRVADRVYVSWRGSAFSEVKDSFRAHFPTHADCVYNGTAKAWSMPLSARYRLRQWLDQTVTADAITWLDGGPSAGSQSYSRNQSRYSRYQHQGPHDRGHGSVAPTVERAYHTLHLLPSAPAELVDLAYRFWSKKLHPDLGGDDGQMAALNTAMEVIRKQKSA